MCRAATRWPVAHCGGRFQKKLPQPDSFSFCFFVSGFDNPVQHILLAFGAHSPVANYGQAVISSELKFSPLRGDAAWSTCAIDTVFGVLVG